MAQAERNGSHPARNPLIWVSLLVVALILFIILGGNRPSVEPADAETAANPEQSLQQADETETTPQKAPETEAMPGANAAPATQQETASGELQASADNDRPMIPGQEAREYIRRLREQGPPWPFEELMQKASTYLRDGRLADAWLLYFFAAREGHVEAMMTLAEMSDPNLFAADNNLLDRPEPVQAYKWYQRALAAGFEPAKERLAALRGWAQQAAAAGDRDAQTLMLDFQ